MDTVQLHNTTSCTVGGDYTPQSSCDKVIGSLGIGLKQKTISIRDIKIMGYNSILICKCNLRIPHTPIGGWTCRFEEGCPQIQHWLQYTVIQYTTNSQHILSIATQDHAESKTGPLYHLKNDQKRILVDLTPPFASASKAFKVLLRYFEGHPTWKSIPFSKWIITLVRVSPHDLGQRGTPSKWPKCFMAYKWGWS